MGKMCWLLTHFHRYSCQWTGSPTCFVELYCRAVHCCYDSGHPEVMIPWLSKLKLNQNGCKWLFCDLKCREELAAEGFVYEMEGVKFGEGRRVFAFYHRVIHVHVNSHVSAIQQISKWMRLLWINIAIVRPQCQEYICVPQHWSRNSFEAPVIRWI